MKFPTLLRSGVLALLLLVFIGRSSGADAPDWWTSSGVVVVNDPANPPDNWAIANVGQLKHIAAQAKDHLDAKLNLTKADWDTAYSNSNPFPFTVGTSVDNYAPVNIGQLKFVASGFYKILHTKAPLYDVRVRLQALGVPPAFISGSGPYFPWAATTATGENYSPVTIGQLKIAFSFDLSTYQPGGGSTPGDADGDGMPDTWETNHNLDPTNDDDALLDADGDGVINLQEFLTGRDPNDRTDGATLPAGVQLVVKIPSGGYMGINTSTWQISSAPDP